MDMRTWSYSLGRGKASVWLDEVPCIVRCIEVVFDWVCDRVYGRDWKDRFTVRYKGGPAFKTGFGDVFHCYIHDPVFQWCSRRYRSRRIEVGYKELKAVLYDDDPEFWDEHERDMEDTDDDEK
jgi:hypothetical protein